MEWLKDKKNMPIVATILGVLIAAAVVMVFLQMKGSSGGGDMSGSTASAPMSDQSGAATTGAPAGTAPAAAPGATTAPAMGAPGTTPAAPGTPGATGAPGAPGAATALADSKPIEASRMDPFLPLNYSANKHIKKPVLPLWVPSPGRLFAPPVDPTTVGPMTPRVSQMAPQPQRRMAGLLYNKRLYAILETNGETQIVKPGDITSDQTAKVEVIEPTKIILRTITSDPKLSQRIEVKMASSIKPPEPTSGQNQANYGGVPNTGGYTPPPTAPARRGGIDSSSGMPGGVEM